jgi:hypothetical protein
MDEKIIIVNGGKIPRIYDFIREGEDEEKALERAFLCCWQESMEEKELAVKYPERSEYWLERATEHHNEAESAMIATYGEFEEIQQKALASDKAVEISEEKYNEMLNILPPIYYTTHNGFTMFCMREMYTGTYTNQYARDNKTGKYYQAMVDVKNPETWIYNRI